MSQQKTSSADNLPVVPVHGPGPPFHASATPSDHDTELWQLRNELQLCLGKIKGYETLGHLFQESKLECARYKQMNEELAKRLDSLTARMPPPEPLNEPMGAGVGAACLTGQSVPVFHSEEARGLASSSVSSLGRDAMGFDVGRGLHRPVALLVDSEHQMNLHLEEVGATKPRTKTRERNSQESSASSPSFVQINSSYTVSPVSPLSSASNTNDQKQQNRSSVMSSDARRTGDDLSSEVNRLAEQLKTVGHSSGASPQDLAADLIRAGINVVKLQKQTRTQQVLIDQMTSQINELQADIATKQRTIRILQQDGDTLRDTVKRMETARQQASEDARVRYSETAKEQDESSGAPNSAEWIEVENHQSHGKAEEGGAVITATPLVEVELRRRVEKLSATVTELVSANRSWSDHCRQLELSHEQQLTSLQSKFEAAERGLMEYKQADQKRQEEFDNILLNSKKQREVEEMAKEEALNQLHLERQQRIDLEQKCIEFSRKTAELENRLMQPCFRQIELAHNSRQVVDPSRSAVEASTTDEREMITNYLVLQEQLRVFKEDFDQERRDRELTTTKMEALRKKVEDQTEQNAALRQQLAQSMFEMNEVKTERDSWRHRFVALSNELQALQKHVRTSTVPLPRDVTHTPVQTPANIHLVRRPSWCCIFCTFKNDGRRTTCEMCGQRKNQDNPLPNDAHMVNGRYVAGLQSFQLATPYPALVSRRLETDALTTDKEPAT